MEKIEGTYNPFTKSFDTKDKGYWIQIFDDYGMATISRRGKFGKINQNGEIIVDCIYDTLYYYQSGLAAFKKNGKWGFINLKGEIQIPAKYDIVYSINDKGRAIVGFKNETSFWDEYNYGVIKDNGEIVIPCEYRHIYISFDNLIRARGHGLQNDDYFDIDGNKLDYERSTYELLQNGFKITYENEFKGIENESGEQIIQPVYDSINYHQKPNLFICSKTEQYQLTTTYDFINEQGVVLKTLSDYHKIGFHYLGAFVIQKNNLFGIIDLNYEVAIPCEYKNIKVLNSKYFEITDVQSNKSIVDISLNVISPYGIKDDFLDGRDSFVFQTTSGKIFMADRIKDKIRELPYSYINGYDMNGWCTLEIFKVVVGGKAPDANDLDRINFPDEDWRIVGGKWGLCNKHMDEIIKPQYDYIKDFDLSFFHVFIGEKRFYSKKKTENDRIYASGGAWGVIDKDNNIIVPIEYDCIKYNELFIVNKGGEYYLDNYYYLKIQEPIGEASYEAEGGLWGIYNQKGEIILPIEYDSITGTRKDKAPFEDGLAIITKNGQSWTIDMTGYIMGVGDIK